MPWTGPRTTAGGACDPARHPRDLRRLRRRRARAAFGSSDNDGDGGNDPTFVATLQLQDTTGDVTDSFERDELIQMILTVRNRRDTTETIDFTDSRTSDFVVVRANSR